MWVFFADKLQVAKLLIRPFLGTPLRLNKMPAIRRGQPKRHTAKIDNAADILHSRNWKTPLTLHWAGGVISGMALDYFGANVHAGFDDYGLNIGRIIRLVARPDSFSALLCSIWQHLAADQKQLVTSFLEDLWGRLCSISS